MSLGPSRQRGDPESGHGPAYSGVAKVVLHTYVRAYQEHKNVKSQTQGNNLLLVCSRAQTLD